MWSFRKHDIDRKIDVNRQITVYIYQNKTKMVDIFNVDTKIVIQMSVASLTHETENKTDPYKEP